jgi:hypothetical protein
VTRPTRAALDRFTARIAAQVAALPPPEPKDVERTALLIALTRLDLARLERQASHDH